MQCECKKKSYGVKDLVNPPVMSNFVQQIQNMKENIYASSKLSPLGRGPMPDLPLAVRNPSWTFGRVMGYGDTVGDLLFPCPICGTAGFLGDSPDNSPGAFYNRSEELLSDSKAAGRKTEGDISGSGVKEIMTWCAPNELLNLVPVAVDEFKEKHQYCLAKALTPENKKENLPVSYQFGIRVDPQADTMGQALAYNYEEPIKTPKRGFRKEQGVLHYLRNILKMRNYHHFGDLMSAFREYDMSNCGKVTAHDIKQMCEKFDLHVSLNLVEKLVAACDLIDKDGLISYQEFIHFLNWKDKLPEKYDYRVKAPKYHNEWVEGTVNTPEDVVDSFKTMTSVSFQEPYSTAGYPAGIPTVRVDRQVPHVRRLRDQKDYGDIRDISCLLQPNIFIDHGVYEEDLYASRTQEEVRLIFEKSCLGIDAHVFDDIWQRNNKNDRMSVEAFRKALDQYVWVNHRFNVKTK